MTKPPASGKPAPDTGRRNAPALPPSPPPLQPGDVFRRLDAIAHRLRQIYQQTVRQSGLTPPQYAVLRELSAGGRRSPAELAERSRCTRATMTGILDTLEKHGLVEREPNPKDRRGLLVALTSQGRARYRATPDLDRVFGRCCTGLSPDELRHLDALLGKLGRSLEARPTCACNAPDQAGG